VQGHKADREISLEDLVVDQVEKESRRTLCQDIQAVTKVEEVGEKDLNRR